MSEAKIIQLAETLGRALAETPETTKLRETRQGLQDDSDTAELLKQYQQQVEKVAQMERDKKPIEVDDKHKLQELEDKLLGAEPFKKFTAAQVDYADLMRKVNEAIRKQLGEPDTIET